jgi:hypothetical protein
MLIYDFRFKHEDQTRPLEVKYDNITVFLHSSNETTADYCDFTGVSIRPNTNMNLLSKYKIGTGDNDGHRQEYLITTKLDGIDSLEKRCSDQLSLSLDVKWPTGRWEAISREGDEYWPEETMDEAGNMYVKERRGIWLEEDEDFSYIVASITQENYVEDAQTMFDTDEAFIAAHMRLSVRDGADKIIPSISQEFTFNITSNGESNTCAAATAEKISQTLDVHKIAFNSNATEFGQIYNFTIAETLIAGVIDSNNACNVKYRVKVLNQTDNEYVFWDDLTEYWAEQFPEHKFKSSIVFDQDKAMLNCSFSYNDV